MQLNWNEIRSKAAHFVREWKDASRENAESQSFWNDFLQVFGVNRRRFAQFEKEVDKAGGKKGYIDLFWPGMLVAEQKSRGKDLDRAFAQAYDYFPGLTDEELPRHVIVSDFERMRVHDLDEGKEFEFELKDLLDYVDRFGFIAGYERRNYREQDPVNVKAAARMGELHDDLKEAGYEGHKLEIYLVRLLFCLFADNSGIFTPVGAFQDFLMSRTREDGSDLGPTLSTLFEVLNTPHEKRQSTLDEELAAFPYVNGKLFEDRLPTAHFNGEMRKRLIEIGNLDWAAISPAIFGSMFQGAMDAEARRELGAHYTSERNILKLIGPLFLDDLRSEFESIKKRNSRPALKRFQEKLADLTLFDPACGCGNFLVIAYRELRRLEIEVLRELYKEELRTGQRITNIDDVVRVSVEQCFGIEYEEFPAQIAQVALWLMDHQMNLEIAEKLGEYFTRLPLGRGARIIHGNALRLDWLTCFGEDQPKPFSYILGNPPFAGKKYQTKEQKADLRAVAEGIRRRSNLDYVAGWFIKAAEYMQQYRETQTAFVATNSISQGDNVGILWGELMDNYFASIDFAHRTFRWDNEAAKNAAVHVVIVGFSLGESDARKQLFEYQDARGEPLERRVSNINPYLIDGPEVVIRHRRKLLCEVKPLRWGSMPNDGGNLLLTQEEKEELIRKEPRIETYIRRFMGTDEFLYDKYRYCLWLKNANPSDLKRMPEVLTRVQAVKQKRLKSSRDATVKLAQTPTLFGEDRQPESRFIAIPEISSENRLYLPIGFLSSEIIASNKLYTMEGGTFYEFGVLSSMMHMAWMRYVAGRLESRYQYSNGIVYRNFPWPKPDGKKRKGVANAAEAVISSRAPYLEDGATMADLYDPLTMPPDLVKAHQRLDKAVDLAYRPQKFTTEINRVRFLFERYAEITAED